MGFDRVDADALRLARERGLYHTTVDNTEYGWHEAVFKIEFGPQVSPLLTAAELKAMLEALIRFSGSHRTVIWLNITTDIVHASVVEAIELLRHFEPKLYVSFKDKASHAPASALPDRLQAAVEKAASKGHMWHPVLHTEVDGKPSRTRMERV